MCNSGNLCRIFKLYALLRSYKISIINVQFEKIVQLLELSIIRYIDKQLFCVNSTNIEFYENSRYSFL